MSEKNYCKHCGKEITGKDHKRKKFCNRSCAASYNNTGRKHSDEEKEKISKSLQRKNPNFDGNYKPIEKRQKLNYERFDNTKEYFCLYCGKKIDNPYGSKANKFCSRKCQTNYELKEFIDRWRNGEETGMKGKYGISDRLRNYLILQHNGKCEKCGFEGTNPYTGRSVLQIHHMDGDCTNNKEENLQVLCPNCHAMTDNFGKRNKNATPGRSLYFGKKR
jgi:endogenous inhibitor of DNA gyrase (YacG/DUF329 family)